MKIAKHLIAITLFLNYLFHISFYPLPTRLRTRLILGLVGLMLLFCHIIQRKKIIIDKSIGLMMICFGLIISASVLTSIVNLTLDIWFIQYAIQSLIFMAAAYLVIHITFVMYSREVSITTIIEFIVWAVAVHNFITIFAAIFPSIQSFLTSIQNFDPLAASKIKQIQRWSSRFIGLGIGAFFNGGILCGYSSILCSFLIRHSRSRHFRIKYIFVFIFLFLSSLFIARTSMLGAFIGIIYMTYPTRFHITIRKYNLGGLVIFYITSFLAIVAIFIYIYIYPPTWMNTSSARQAFELYNNFSEGKGLTTRSTESLQKMFIYPSSIKTWVIGDAKFNTNGGMSYYMSTDVGYSRLLFYFGIIGTVLFLGSQIILSYLVGRLSQDKSLKIIMLFTVLYSFILNIKGLADVNYFLFLFLSYFVVKKKNDKSFSQLT